MKEIYTVYKDTRNMSRAEWLTARKAGIGGSDAAAIIGLNPFSSPLTVWADKTSADEPQEESESEAIWLGNVLEDHVARRYAEESGLNIVRCNQMMRSIEHPYMLANIDRRVKGKRIGVEIKTTSSFTKTDFAGGDVNPWYYAQCTISRSRVGMSGSSWFWSSVVGCTHTASSARITKTRSRRSSPLRISFGESMSSKANARPLMEVRRRKKS